MEELKYLQVQLSKALFDTILLEYVLYPIVIGVIMWAILCICYWNIEDN